MSRSKFCWSDLPPELLLAIAKRLETRLGIFHFRVVCKDWHRSVSLVLVSHKNMLSPVLPHKFKSKLQGGTNSRLVDFYMECFNVNHLILVQSCIFLVKSTEENVPPWLMTVDEINPGKLCLRNPYSRSTVMDMPPGFPKNLGLERFDVVEMGRVYSLRFDEKCYDFVFSEYDKFNNLFEEDHKVVLLGKTRSKIDDFIAVVLYGNGILAAIGLNNGSVLEVYFRAVKKFDDIVAFKGMVYAIDRRGRLYSMDGGCILLNIVKNYMKPGSERMSRLVESCGELYLVRKCSVSRPGLEKMCMGFRVYKLDQSINVWEEIDSIGNDWILFVSPDRCFFARTSDFFGWQGNCIVVYGKDAFMSYAAFNDDQSSYSYRYERDGEKLCLEVFNMEDCEFTAFEDIHHYSDVLWPPPQWISPDACFPTVKFQGVYISVGLIPTLETIWAKHGNLIGSDTVRNKKILASLLEELAEFVIALKSITAGTLSDSQAKDLRSNLLDFQRRGLIVDWLFPIIDKAVLLHKDKSMIESITTLDNEIAKLNGKKRDLLAQRAKLKEELKEDIDLDDFFGRVLW